MKLHSLFEFETNGGFVGQIKSALQQAGWTESMQEMPVGATFVTRRAPNGGTEFRVAVVNSMGGSNNGGQVSSKLFNDVITPFYRNARAQNVEFTQPVGMANSGFQNDRHQGTVMQFFIGEKY